MISPLAEPSFLDQMITGAGNLWQNLKRTISTPFGEKTSNPVRVMFDNPISSPETLPGGGVIRDSRDVFPSPTPTPNPSIPPVNPTITQPYSPQDIPQTYYTNRNQGFNPDLYKAIVSQSAPDYLKRLALALSTQESSGGSNLYGDYTPTAWDKEGKPTAWDMNKPRSFGPYHIYNVRKPEIMEKYGIKTDDEYYQKVLDPIWSTQYFFDEMNKYINKGNTPEEALGKWNKNSGYINAGPKYNVDLPQMATTSSFFTK